MLDLYPVVDFLDLYMYVFTLDLNRKSLFSLYKHFRINDANRSTNDATSKHATQTEIKTTQLRNRRNFKKTQLRITRRTRRHKLGY